MGLRRFIFNAAFLFLLTAVSLAQTDSRAKTAPTVPKQIAQAVKSSPAYAEILLRKTERDAQLEELLLTYTDEFPKVKELKFEVAWLQKNIDDISAVNVSDAAKLTLALGKLLVRQTELRVDLFNLHKQYNDDNIDVKRLRRKIEVYDKAIKEILL